jgi:3-hydroxyisobutyryl-CoA hydrolase
MGLTGERLKGRDLAKCGVATHFVPMEKIENMKNAIIENVDKDTDLKKIQSIVKEYSEIIFTPENFEFPKYNNVKKVFIPDSLENIVKRLINLIQTGSEEDKSWASKHLDYLNSCSQISLAVALEQIKRGMHIKSKEEAFNLEAQIVAA